MRVLLPLYLLFLILLFPDKAFAYLDPGTGSYLFQIVIAGFLGVLFFVKTFWINLKSFITNLLSKNRKEKSDPEK